MAEAIVIAVDAVVEVVLAVVREVTAAATPVAVVDAEDGRSSS